MDDSMFRLGGLLGTTVDFGEDAFSTNFHGKTQPMLASKIPRAVHLLFDHTKREESSLVAECFYYHNNNGSKSSLKCSC